MNPPAYLFSICASWGLTASGGLLAVVGVVAAFMPPEVMDANLTRSLCVWGFAGMTGFAVACGQCAAAAAMHACERGRFVKVVFWPALVCVIGFAVASGIGIHLGWSILAHGSAVKALPADWIVNCAAAFVALAKPSMSWIIQGRKGIDALDAEARDREEEARLEAARQRDREATIANAPNVTALRQKRVSGAAAAASFFALAAPGGASEAAPVVQHEAPQMTQPDARNEAPREAPNAAPRAAPKTRVTKQDKMRQAVMLAVLQRGAASEPSNRAIAERLGCSASTVDRAVKAMTPLQGAAA